MVGAKEIWEMHALNKCVMDLLGERDSIGRDRDREAVMVRRKAM